LQLFSPEVTLICDQFWINVGAYEPKSSYLTRWIKFYPGSMSFVSSKLLTNQINIKEI